MKLSFITPTEIDLRELFTLGLGSKRGDETKIGHKGSGMKFTIALLHRLGSSLTVQVGGVTWTSGVATIEIRGQSHEVVTLTSDLGEVRETHITITAGADTWTECWFALRELLQNCLDEGGHHQLGAVEEAPVGGTVMTIELTDQLNQAWVDRDHWHHPRCTDIIYESPRESGLFFHGFRISTEPTWEFCYDVTTILSRDNLSEDRQARGVEYSKLFGEIVKNSQLPPAMYHLMIGDNVEGDVRLVIETCYYQTGHGQPNSGGFIMSKLEDAFTSRYGINCCFTPEKNERECYYASAQGFTVIEVGYSINRLLRYSSKLKEARSLVPTMAARLKPVAIGTLDRDFKSRLRRAINITRSLRPPGCEVLVVERESVDSNENICALAVIEDNKVMLVRGWAVNATANQLVEALIEEYTHISSREGDGTIAFEKALIRSLANELMPKKKAAQFSL